MFKANVKGTVSNVDLVPSLFTFKYIKHPFQELILFTLKIFTG